MGKKSLCLVISCALLAYFVYTPLPDNIEQPWKLMMTWAAMRVEIHLSAFMDILGVPPFVLSYLLEVPPTSDAKVTVTDTLFNKVPVRVFEPKQKSSAMRRAVFYIHGGGWTMGDASWIPYDYLGRQMADKLDAVVISTNYRLSPQYHFPTQFEDVYDALRWFLRKKVLAEYGVDPTRICIAGDSAGGNLAAAVTQQSAFLDILGFPRFVLFRLLEVPPTSDAKVTVTDTLFNKVPVRVFEPKPKSSTMRRAVFYIHGGGGAMGNATWIPYDYLGRQMVDKLDAVVISTNYRLSPQYHFPTQFEDVYDSLRWFLRKKVLAEYGVDPTRICIAGDSAGGNLAAAVTQQLLDDPEVKIKVKIQSLIYPALQALDMNLPSCQENAHMPILRRYELVEFWSSYFTSDKALKEAMLANQHTPVESSHLFQFVNWSTLLPQRFQKGHLYTNPIHGPSDLAKKYPGFLDVRASPLLASDSKLQGLPLTHILTCQYDVLRDDGLMYASRLRAAGVQVVHEHVEDWFHGILIFSRDFRVGQRELIKYLRWLEENL